LPVVLVIPRGQHGARRQDFQRLEPLPQLALVAVELVALVDLRGPL
jgi:hypothetical protein